MTPDKNRLVKFLTLADAKNAADLLGIEDAPELNDLFVDLGLAVAEAQASAFNIEHTATTSQDSIKDQVDKLTGQLSAIDSQLQTLRANIETTNACARGWQRVAKSLFCGVKPKDVIATKYKAIFSNF